MKSFTIPLSSSLSSILAPSRGGRLGAQGSACWKLKNMELVNEQIYPRLERKFHFELSIVD